MEVHCEQNQQDKLAEILRSTLGNALVTSPLFGEETIDHHAGSPVVEKLPSPEDLKYRILLKAKNLYVIKDVQKMAEASMASSEESSSASNSDSDLKKGERNEISRSPRYFALFRLTDTMCAACNSFHISVEGAPPRRVFAQ